MIWLAIAAIALLILAAPIWLLSRLVSAIVAAAMGR
jgi:hypothetical protein